MKESVIYQEILLKGKTEGKVEEKNQIALNMLRSNISTDLVAQFTGLTLKQIEKLQKLLVKTPRAKKTTRTTRSPKP